MSPELEDYIEQHISPEPDYLRKIDRHTQKHHINGRMCSGHIQGRLLKMLTRMINPQRVLELGTFTGYSALCMAEALEDNSRIHTIEANDELEEEIKKNLESSPHGKKVTLHIGDALEEMKKWDEGYFDLVVIDADKREYPAYLEAAVRLIRPGGFILADNTLWDGHVAETCKHSSQTSGIMKFNDMVTAREDLEVAVLPIRDGLTLIRKNR